MFDFLKQEINLLQFKQDITFKPKTKSKRDIAVCCRKPYENEVIDYNFVKENIYFVIGNKCLILCMETDELEPEYEWPSDYETIGVDKIENKTKNQNKYVFYFEIENILNYQEKKFMEILKDELNQEIFEDYARELGCADYERYYYKKVIKIIKLRKTKDGLEIYKLMEKMTRFDCGYDFFEMIDLLEKEPKSNFMRVMYKKYFCF